MVTGLIVLLFGVLIGPIFPIIEEDMAQLLEDYPASVLAIVGNADMSTPEGWYTGENFSLVHPIGFLLVLVVLGGRAIGGEEQRRTMGLLLANPISRSRVVIEKGIAMAVYAAILGVLAFAGTVAGSLLGGLGISVVNIGDSRPADAAGSRVRCTVAGAQRRDGEGGDIDLRDGGDSAHLLSPQCVPATQ